MVIGYSATNCLHFIGHRKEKAFDGMMTQPKDNQAMLKSNLANVGQPGRSEGNTSIATFDAV